MAYADYDFYIHDFFGDVLIEYSAKKWLDAASDALDTLTFGRLTFAFPTAEAHAVKVKKAVCAVAETLYFVDCERRAAAAQQKSDGSYRRAVASVSSGRETVSYASGSAADSVYAAAAADADDCTKLVLQTALKYLANVPDANGINLFYGGV